jgi:hypothetical protein
MLTILQYGGHNLLCGGKSNQESHVCLQLGLTDYRSLSLSDLCGWPCVRRCMHALVLINITSSLFVLLILIPFIFYIFFIVVSF